MPAETPQLLTIKELCRRSSLSKATIHRLKKAGLIPFYQPAGKGGRVLFPADAIERSGDDPEGDAQPSGPNPPPKGSPTLPGPRPNWMRKLNQPTN